MGEVHLTDRFHPEPLEILHKRAGHASKSILVEGHRRQAFVGGGLGREHMSKKCLKSLKAHLCKMCALAKITRFGFHEREAMQSTVFAEIITADISVYVNCASREGYKYVLVFACVGSKDFWPYPLVTRSGEEVERCARDLVYVQLKKYPGTHRVKRYHADGGKELIDIRVKKVFFDAFGTVFTHSSTDTPELNAVSERKFRTLGEMTLAMLRESGLPVPFWWLAYCAACYIARRLPTKTYKGWMSAFECVPGGEIPDLRFLRIWGCKAYVLTPKGDRRKDWDDKAKTGHFVAYSTEKMGHGVLLNDSQVIDYSVHVLFDEKIPPRGKEYYEDFDAQIVQEADKPAAVEDFQYLVGKTHMDGGLLYIINRVIVRKGLIVGYRSMLTGGKDAYARC
jgi:hypothetical protein